MRRLGLIVVLVTVVANCSGSQQVPDESFNPQIKESGYQINFCLAGEQTTIELLEKMNALGLTVRDVETRQSNLEDVFLGLTGTARKEGNNAD